MTKEKTAPILLTDVGGAEPIDLPAPTLRTILAPWLLPKTVTSDEWCSAVDSAVAAKAGSKDKLVALILEMGHVIRSLDEDNEHLEFWTQDGEYILDGRFPAP